MRTADEILARLETAGSVRNIEGMRRFGIQGAHLCGVPMPVLRAEARRIGRDHPLAGELWASGLHEARLLATLIADPAALTVAELTCLTEGFDSWDLVDQACLNLLWRVPAAIERIEEFAADEREYVRRTAFSLIAARAVHDRKADDEAFAAYLPLIVRYRSDERNFVRKAVNWALRGIGKRNLRLHERALATAQELAADSDRTARWIGRDAVRELQDEKTIARIRRHEK